MFRFLYTATQRGGRGGLWLAILPQCSDSICPGAERGRRTRKRNAPQCCSFKKEPPDPRSCRHRRSPPCPIFIVPNSPIINCNSPEENLGGLARVVTN